MRASWLLSAVCLQGCSSEAVSDSARQPDAASTGALIADAGESAPAEKLAEHLFFELPERAVRIKKRPGDANGEEFESLLPAARIYARFISNGESPDRLCVVFNGGPGIGSQLTYEHLSEGLVSACDQLYVDARNTGFSYSLGQSNTLSAEAHGNVYSDAADTLLVLKQYLANSSAQKVTLIGESYGGLRSAVMVQLVDALAETQSSTPLFLDYSDDALNAEQFAPLSGVIDSVVWLQPFVGGTAQDLIAGEFLQEPGSVVEQAAKEEGQTFERCSSNTCDPWLSIVAQLEAWGRSVYDVRAADNWLDLRLGEQMASADRTAQAELDERFLPVAREQAWKFLTANDSVDTGAWLSHGQLTANDRYYVAFNSEVFDAFFFPPWGQQLAFTADHWLGAAIHVVSSRTLFISDATFDGSVVTQSLPRLFEAHPAVDKIARTAEGWEVVWARNAEQKSAVTVRSFPAGHSIGVTHAAELGTELTRWLELVDR